MQQVRLDVVARFPAARRSEHENVVVQPASPCIAADGSVGGKQGFSLVGSSLRVEGRLAFGFCGRESLRKLIARGVFGDGFEFGDFHKQLLKLEVGDRWRIDGREKRTGEGGEGNGRVASSLSPLIARAGLKPSHCAAIACLSRDRRGAPPPHLPPRSRCLGRLSRRPARGPFPNAGQ